MPIGGNAQVTINVGARLQVLQSSVNEIQKVLDKLQPNSTGFKNLQTILNQITREMDRLQVQASKPFGSQNQFNQTEKTLDKIEDSLNNAQIALGRISFKDLKLSPDQEQQFKDLRNDIAETKKALDSFKNEQKIELFKNADFKKFADSIDSNLIKKNFSEVAQAVSGESERITNEVSKLTSKINQASKEISIGENVKNFTGFLDKNKVIKKEFEQFFTQTEQELKFKPKQQNAFYEYLKEYFSLNDQQLNALKKLSAQKVQEVMTQEGYFEPQLKKAKNAATRQVSYNTQMTELRAQADAAAAAMGTVETAEEKIAEQSNATEDTVRALEERIRQLELQLTGAAQAAPEMKNGIAGMTGELNSMKTSLEQANAQFLQLQRQRQTFESIKSGIVNFMGFNQVLNITRNAVRVAIDHIKELDTTMNGIAIVTDMTTADLWKQVDAYSAMAQNFGVTIQGAYEVSKIYYQAGYETNDVLTLTNETLKLSKISGLDYATTTDYMMTAMRGFKLEMEDASRVVDVYSNLAANTAVSQQELAEAMTRTASSMESVGATFEETSAMIATMVAVTRESANNIGSAMKSIASRYGELTKDPAALLDADGEAMSFNKVDTALRSVGITLQTTDHQFRDFTDVIIELAQKWDTLDSAQQRYIATQFAGNRQQSRFLALVSNIDLLQENLANAQNSEDVGTLQALKAMDSLESKINQVQVAYQQFYTTIGIENAWKTLLDGTRSVIDTLNSLPKLFNAIPLNAIAAISSVISVIKAVLFAGLQLVAKELKNFSTQNNQQVEDQNKEGGERAANSWIDWFLRIWRGRKGELTSEVQSTMADATGKILPNTAQNGPDTTDRSAKNSKKLFGTISVEGKRAAQTISTIGSAFSTLSLLINTTSQSGKVLSGTLMGLGGVITTLASAATGNVFGIVTGILNIISGISTAYESAEERLARLNKEAEELNNKAKEAKANYNTLQRSVDKLQELEDKRYESAEAAEEYQTAVDELASSYPELINGINELGEITIDTASADRILAEAREKAAKATRDAAKAEAKSLEEKISEQEEQLEADRSYARMNLTQGSFIRTFQNVSSDGDFSDETLSYVLQQELGVDDIDENLISNFRNYLEAVFSDNKNQSVESFNTLVRAAKIFFENINKLAEDTEGYELSQELFSPIFEGYKELQSLQNSLRGQAKIDFLSIIDAQNSDNKINSKFLKSSGLRAFLAQDIYDNFEQTGMTLDEYEQAEGTRLIEADKQWLEWYKKLGEEKQELLDTMFSDSDIYSADDIISSLGIDDTLKSTVINYYTEISEFYKTSTEEILKELEVGFKGQEDYKYTKQDLNFWGSVNTEYNRLIKAGLETRADAFKDAQNQVFGEINQIAQKDAVSARRIKQVILDNGMSTKEGLEESLKYLESQGYKKNDKIYDSLVQAYDALIENLSIGLQANLSSMGKELDDSLSELDKLKSGMDFEEVSNFLDKVKNLDIGIGIENFVDKDGKLILTEDAFETYWTAFQEKNLAIGDKWTALYNDLLAGTDYDYNVEQGFNKDYIQEAIDSNSESLKAFAESLGAIVLDNDGNWLDIETVTQNLTQAADNYKEWFELLQNLSNKAKEGAKKTIDRAKGIYKNYEFDTDYTVNELKGIAKDIKLDPNSDEYAIKTSLNSAYSNLISDVLSKGFQNINLKDYKGLKDQGKDINFDNITYKDFIKEYVDFTGKSTEEINALIVQAMEKDAAATSGAAQDALRDVNFYSKERASASLDTIQKLADALGVSINTILGEYIAGLDEYSVNLSNVPLDNITNSTEILFDSISSVINSIAKYVSAGLEGKLSGADITNFNAQLSAYDGVDQLVAADFVQTTQGLKLSEEAAFRLYSQLQKIEDIQHLITFNDLMGSLRDTNEHYKSMSTILARIAELNRNINEIDSNGGDTARRDMYQQELDIAKEIAAVRLTTDDSGFDFMSNKLPAPLQNGVDYIDSIGKMFKSMNTAATTGKGLIDVTDFYNIVNELNNMASVGGEIEFLGMKLDGSLESASELIQKGFSALKNIDGEGTKVDLSSFGVDFASGADAMGKNIEDGIHAIADSQIKMIDAMIQLLETVVAMEKLGDIDVDNNGIEVEEIFDNLSPEGAIQAATTYTEKWEEFIAYLDSDKLSSEAKDALNQVYVNNHTLWDILHTGVEGLENLGFEADTYAALMNSLLQWAKSGDYNLNNLYASIKEVMASSNFNGEFQIGDLHIQVGYGQTVVFDPKTNTWKDAKNNDHKTAEEAMRANIEAQIPNAQKNSTVVLDNGNYQTTIEANGVDLKVVTTTSGEQTYTIKGVEGSFNSQNEALYALYQKTQEDSNESIGSFQQFVLNISGEVLPEITVANPEKVQQATQTQLNKLAQALVGDSNEEIIRTAKAIGIEIDVSTELTAAQRAQIAELAGIESRTVALNIETNLDENSNITEVLAAGDTPIVRTVKVNIETGEDKTGLFSSTAQDAPVVNGLSAKGTGTLPLENCEFSVIDGTAILKKGNDVIVEIPLENLKAVGEGTLASENLTLTYDSTGNPHLYDENGEELTTLSAILSEAMKVNGEIHQLSLKVAADTITDLATEAPIEINGVINAQGEIGTLTITPSEGAESVQGELTATVNVGDVGTVTGTSKDAQITATAYTVTFTDKAGKTDTVVVTGEAQLAAVISSYGAGFKVNQNGTYSLDGDFKGETTLILAKNTVEDLQSKIPEIKVQVTLEPTTTDVLNNKELNWAPSYMGGSQITSPAQVQKNTVETEVKVDKTQAEEDVKNLQEEASKSQTMKINGDNSGGISSANQLESYVNSKNPAIKVSAIIDNALSKVNNLIAKINGMTATINVNANMPNISVSTGSGSGGGIDPINYVRGLARGNVALAKGRETLMGELGPELYVTGGHYYIAGQNGAEFVNLPDDAIVFNHLQTERLLKSGSAGRGKAIGGEKCAVAHAGGNAEGSAMASASAALAELKKIRAMWDAMLNASIADLGSKAGLGKKAGGGSGSKTNGVTLDAGYIKDLERWYNLLRQIDRLEQDINYEEKLRAKLEADSIAHGKEIYESQRKTYDMLQKEVDRRVELAELKKGYYEQRMEEIANGPWGNIFYFNEEGTPQMKNLEFLANVFASTEEGGAVHSAREQYAMLQEAGFGGLLQFKEDGSRIEWYDEEGKAREEAYKEAVEAFSAKLDAQTDEINGLREDYIEEMGTILELQTKQNEILTQIRENTIEVEKEVLKALEESRQAEIDELQDQRDALSDSADKFINGLNDSLNRERDMYSDQESDKELTSLRRQLGILQRSGASASQIRSIQEKISQREQDAYFNQQQKQVDAVKQASDLQLERLDSQLSIMAETLEYQKAHGLLWEEVRNIMQGSSESITEFITTKNPEWWAKSNTEWGLDIVALRNKVEEWTAHRDDTTAVGTDIKNAIQNGIAAITEVVGRVSESIQYNAYGDGGTQYSNSAGNYSNNYSSPSGGYSSNITSPSSDSTSSTSSTVTKKTTTKKSEVTPTVTASTRYYGFQILKQSDNSVIFDSYKIYKTEAERDAALLAKIASYGTFARIYGKKYKEGGLIDFTGPAWVDGTKSKPEGILNAEQLDMLRNSVLTRSNPIAALITDYSDSVRGTANSNTYNTIDRGESTVIENAQVIMNVSKMSNDYDARQAGRAVLDEMVRISRKTKPTGVSRR